MSGNQAQEVRRLHGQAIDHLRARRVGEGLALLEKAAALAPESGEIQMDMATAHWQAGRADVAEKHYAKAVALSPDNPFARNNYGAFLLAQLKLAEAEEQLLRANTLKPGHFETLNNLGLIRYRNGDLAGAEDFLLQAVAANPAWANAHANLGNVFKEMWRMDEAEAAFRRALQCRPNSAAALTDLGNLYFAMGRDAEAEEAFRRAISFAPPSETPWTSYIALLERQSRLDDAMKQLDDVKGRFPGSRGVMMAEAKLLRRAGRTDEAIALLEKCREAIRTEQQRSHTFFIDLFFELGQMYDAKKDADKAFAAFCEAKAGQAKSTAAQRIDRAGYPALLDRLQKEFPFGAAPEAPPMPGGAPEIVFLVGFPRSGTTLMDQILSSHPDITVAEEKPAVQRMISRLGEDYPAGISALSKEDIEAMRAAFFAEHGLKGDEGGVFIDKLPLNLVNAGLIHRVFPQAKFILALRHPCDAVLSCFMQSFRLNPAMAQFLDLDSAAGLYAKAFDLWKTYAGNLPLAIHTVRYEDVVGDFRPTVAALLDFLGVGWSDNVLAYDKTARAKERIHTPSYRQVTEKIHTRARGRWLRYRAHLAPVLGILAPYAEAFGYTMEEGGDAAPGERHTA